MFLDSSRDIILHTSDTKTSVSLRIQFVIIIFTDTGIIIFNPKWGELLIKTWDSGGCRGDSVGNGTFWKSLAEFYC